jgi:hydrogenase-4 transcriptional activator
MAYPWPGNVRELENVIERAMILNKSGPLSLDRLVPLPEECEESVFLAQGNEPLILDEVVSKHITHVLKLTKGKVHGPGGAAALLGINPSTLRNRMDGLGIPYGRKKRVC